MVVGTISLVYIKAGGKYGIESIHSHTPLEAGRCLLAAETLHFYLILQILGTLVDMGKAIDHLSGLRRHNGHQILVLGIQSQIIGHTNRIQRGT